LSIFHKTIDEEISKRENAGPSKALYQWFYLLFIVCLLFDDWR
jgi:hypothetical protein